jgi:hypothetical protein
MQYNREDFESLTDMEIAELNLAANLIVLRRIEVIHSYMEKNEKGFNDFVNHTSYAEDLNKLIDYRNSINSEVYRAWDEENEKEG